MSSSQLNACYASVDSDSASVASTSAPSTSDSASITANSKTVASDSTAGEISAATMNCGDTMNCVSRISVVSPIKVAEMTATDTPVHSAMQPLKNGVQLSVMPTTAKMPLSTPTSNNQSVQGLCSIQSESANPHSVQVGTSGEGMTDPSAFTQSSVPVQVSASSSVSGDMTATYSRLLDDTTVTIAQVGNIVSNPQKNSKISPIDLSVVSMPEREDEQPSKSTGDDAEQFSFMERSSDTFQYFLGQDMHVPNKEFQKYLLELRQLEALAAKKEEERRNILRLYNKQKAHILKIISGKSQKLQSVDGASVSSTGVNPALASGFDLSSQHLKTESAQSLRVLELDQEQLDLSTNSTLASHSSETEGCVQDASSVPKSKTTAKEVHSAVLEVHQSSTKNQSSTDMKSVENKIPAHQNKIKTSCNVDQVDSIPYPEVLSCPYIKRTSPVDVPLNWKPVTHHVMPPNSAHSQPPFHIAGTFIIPTEEHAQSVRKQKMNSLNTENGNQSAANLSLLTSSKSNVTKNQKDQYPRSPETTAVAAKDDGTPDAGFHKLSSLYQHETKSSMNRQIVNSNPPQSLPLNLNSPSNPTDKGYVSGTVMKNVECLSGADNKSSKMTVQNSASELDTSRFNGESSECIVQHELQQAVAMQCGKRVGPAKMPKQVQYSRTSEMSARSPFTPVPYSNTYPGMNISAGEGPSSVSTLIPLAPKTKQCVSNSSKSQGAYFQNWMTPGNIQGDPKTAADCCYVNNPALPPLYPLLGPSVGNPQKEPHFPQSRQEKAVVQVSRNKHPFLQAPERCISDSQQTMGNSKNQPAHQQVHQQAHFIQQQQHQQPSSHQPSAHQPSDVQCGQPLLGFCGQVPASIRMHCSQQQQQHPTAIAPQGNVIVLDSRTQTAVATSQQRMHAVYPHSSHQIAPVNACSSLTGPIKIQKHESIAQVTIFFFSCH